MPKNVITEAARKSIEIPSLTPIRRNEKDNYGVVSDKILPASDSISSSARPTILKDSVTAEFNYYGSNKIDKSVTHLPSINNASSVVNKYGLGHNLYVFRIEPKLLPSSPINSDIKRNISNLSPLISSKVQPDVPITKCRIL